DRNQLPRICRFACLPAKRRAGYCPVIIAIDGPTASGKGTISKELAKHFALPFLDTGLLYRAVGWTVRENGTDADNPADALAACNFDSALLGDPALRSEAVGGLASR